MLLTSESSIWKYIANIFLSIDQLGNAFAGGNPDNTISARVGYYNHYHKEYLETKIPWYWRWFERIIDTTFYPVDGKGHCHEAYHNDAGEIFDNRVTNFLIAIAATIIIIPSCIVMALVLYLLSALRIVKKKTIRRDKNLEKRLSVCAFQLTSTNQEIEEHGTNFNLDISRQRLKELKREIDIIDTAINPPLS